MAEEIQAPVAVEENNSSSSTEPEQRLVRLYKKDQEDAWAEIITGTFLYDLREIDDKFFILIESEDNQKHTVEVLKGIEYLRNSDTVIVWTDETGSWALSYGTQQHCDELRSRIAFNLCSALIFNFQHDAMDGSVMESVSEDSNTALPFPEFSNLKEIEQILAKSMYNLHVKQRLAKQIIDEKFLQKFYEIFRMNEDLENKEELYTLYSIFRLIVLLNNYSLLQELLKEENIIPFVSVFEYDPAFPNIKPNYRDYLKNENLFKQVVRIENQDILRLIHTTFRAQYLKDVILPRILDDETFSTFTMLIKQFQREIVEQLQRDSSFASEIGPLLSAEDKFTRNQVISFLKEYLGMAKTVAHSDLYKSIGSLTLLCFVENCLQDSKDLNVLAVTEILVHLIEHNPGTVREFMLSAGTENKSKLRLFPCIIKELVGVGDVGIKWQLSYIIKCLCEPSVVPANDRLQDEFLNAVYPEYATELFQPLSNTKTPNLELDFLLTELLCSFIKHHKFRSKYLLIGTTILVNVLKFTTLKDKFMNLAAVRVVKNVLICNDNFYNRYLIKHNCFAPILQLAIREKTRDNLITSAILEMFDFISKKTGKLIVEHLLEAHRNELQELGNLFPVFSNIINPSKTSTQEEKPETAEEKQSSYVPTLESKGTWSNVDRSEEAYFEDDDEDDFNGLPIKMEESTVKSSPPPLRKLVDYEDDDGFPFQIESPTKKVKQ